MIGLIQFLPVLGLTLLAGQVADHHDRKKIMLITLAVDLVSTIGLAVLGLRAADHLADLRHRRGVRLLARLHRPGQRRARADARAARADAQGAGLELVGLAGRHHRRAGARRGGAGAGLARRRSGHAAGWAYATSAVLYVAAWTALLLVRANTTPERQAGSRWEMMKEGLAYVWRNKIVLGAISLDLFAVLLGGATLLLPAFAADVLKVGPEGYGILRASPGAGAAIIAFYLASNP